MIHPNVTLCNTALVGSLLPCAYFWGAFRPWVLPLVQLVPALHQLDNHWPAEVHQLKPGHVGSAMHKPLQRYVLKALRETEGTTEGRTE